MHPSLQPYVPSPQPYVPSLQPYVPSLQPFVPSLQPFVPSLQPFVPRRVSEDTLHSMRGFGPLVDEEEGRGEGREGGRGEEGEGVEMRIARMEEGRPAEAGEAWPALRSPSHAAAGGADATLVGRPPYASTAGEGHSEVDGGGGGGGGGGGLRRGGLDRWGLRCDVRLRKLQAGESICESWRQLSGSLGVHK